MAKQKGDDENLANDQTVIDNNKLVQQHSREQAAVERADFLFKLNENLEKQVAELKTLTEDLALKLSDTQKVVQDKIFEIETLNKIILDKSNFIELIQQSVDNQNGVIDKLREEAKKKESSKIKFDAKNPEAIKKFDLVTPIEHDDRFETGYNVRVLEILKDGFMKVETWDKKHVEKITADVEIIKFSKVK